ncbi:ESX secretion-associated protein EspG [Nocardia sp. NPDC049190]|uniref:ESX secretion-associated protein EspG n=1 Tax=Nocardia sp. NPDC049190 TaxID=3155650 RepID=UPI0033FB5B0E
MRRTWDLTDIEFAAAWAAAGEDQLPRPLLYTSRTELLEDSERELRQAAAHVRVVHGAELDSVLAALGRPDIRVIVHGRSPGDPDNPKGQIRLHACRLRGTGYLVTQLPGETVWHSGGYTIDQIDALDLAAAVVASLPAVGPGRHHDVVLPDGDVDHGDVIRARARRFLALPAAMTGSVTVVQGHSVFGPRGISSRTVRWRDLADDGRYVVTGKPPAATGTDARRMAAAINNAIAHVVTAIHEERR